MQEANDNQMSQNYDVIKYIIIIIIIIIWQIQAHLALKQTQLNQSSIMEEHFPGSEEVIEVDLCSNDG